ncbi:unnamed protein product [Toxocara canis]|uniref:Nuclear pore complex protein Nup98-Nup96 n=1 Tax=Toxocara canis TaxID=6265 RepID=A0A183TWH8_TOXCA|nr:unnamed protein product [Toxocara canis]
MVLNVIVAGTAPFGSTATSTSLFGSSAAKPTTSLFGAPAAQTGFGMAPAATNVVAAQAAPIVLGADVSQTLIQNTIIEAQLASCPYGDSPLLKLISTDSLKKADMPNPTSMERQLRFLASKAQGTTTASAARTGAGALSSLPPAGSPIVMPSQLNNSRTMGHLSYNSIYSSPTLDVLPTSPVVDLTSRLVLTSFFGPSLLRRMSKDTSTSIFTDRNGEGEGKCEDPKQKTRQIDLSRLHKSLQESRQRKSSASSGTPAPGSAGDSRDRDGAGVQPHSPTTYNVSENGDGAPPRPVLSPETENAHLKRRAELRTEQPPRLDLNIELSPSSSVSFHDRCDKFTTLPPSVNVREEVADKPHPAGIRLRRLDYVCEPSLEQLALMAERDGGVCHLEKGFTVRRFAYGSVFWPGPFDLSNVDIDKVVHFRQNEVIIYPDDLDKPPIGEQLNRFAEISLERVWPRDKVTKESIMDPIRLEQMHFRERLERVSARMGANFKDYRPETGTWVFTVSHFTKYGLPDESDDDEMPSAEELRVAMGESRLQNAVQRDRLRLSAQQVPEVFPAAPDESATQRRDMIDSSVRVFKDVSQMPTPIFNRALGGLCAEEMKTVITPKATILDFDQTIDSIVFTPAKGIRERKHKIEPTDGLIALGASAQLDELMEDSFTFERGKERAERKTRRMHLKAIEPKNDLTFVVSLSESFVTKMRAKRGTIIDEALFNLRRTRVGWATNGLLANSGLPASFDVHLLKLDYPDELPRDYIVDMFEHNIRLSSRMAERQFMDKSVEMGVVERITPSRDYAQMVDSFIATSKQSKMPREESVWKLCSALFTHPSLLIASSDYTRGVVQRDCVGDWLREAIAAKHLKLPPPGKKRILFHVLAGNLSEAVEEAISANRPLLAVEFWVQSQATDFMEEDLLKIYMVMAGMMQVDLKSRRVFVCEGLNWMRALGVFVWYYNPYHAPLKEVISAFEEDLEARSCRDSLGNSVFYELIKLASERSHPLELILEPSAFDNQPLDYHLSWHLWCVLRSIGYEHMDEFMERCLHIRYAEQLAGMGLVHLAIFVLMHISDLNARQNAVTEMIDRVAPEADEALYKKVESVCALPPETIAHSKYMRAKLEGDEEAMCLHALDAAMYQEAHSLFYDSVAPSAVTRDDDELLGRLFEKFEAESDKISCWGPRGQIYTDYYHLKEGIHEITDECHVCSCLLFFSFVYLITVLRLCSCYVAYLSSSHVME